MLIDTPDPRYWGGGDRDGDPGPDPDDERERRWEPIGRRLFVPAAGSMSCFLATPFVGGPLASWALTLAGVALCAQFVRVSLQDAPPRGDRSLPAGEQRE